MLNKSISYFLILFSFIYTQESKVVEIPLEGSAGKKELEMSGLTWYKNELILMPQYIDYDDPAFYAISKSKLNQWLSKQSAEGIVPQKIKLIMPDYRKTIKGYQGFEAVCFDGNSIYLVIESKHDGIMKSFIVKGKMERKKGIITIDKDVLREIPIPINIKNMGYESIIKYKNQILVIFEANGKNINPDPKIISFNRSLEQSKLLKFDNLEYRLTDATQVDKKGNFWAINFYWPGEEKRLKPALDEVLMNTTEGPTHAMFDHVERLVEYKIYKNEIKRTSSDPIQLTINKESRNWEGVVRLDKKGFIMIVDEYPRTILAFVEK
ncbi:MAG: hypothetical protein VX746_04200 [Candidatus Neomarinimicrobiota bacterium]|nr:hypothetical protein [Candidatus Neomarinimicrobiota bacterium]